MRKLRWTLLFTVLAAASAPSAFAQTPPADDQPTPVEVRPPVDQPAVPTETPPTPVETKPTETPPTPVETKPVPTETAPTIAPVETHPAAGGESAGEPEHHAGHEHPVVDNSKYFNWFNVHYGDKDFYGGPLGDGKMDAEDLHGTKVALDHEEPMSPPFIFMLINFGLLLILLGKYGAPAARKLAEERHDLIKNALDEAAKLRAQAQEKLTEYETKLKDADKEIKALVEGLRTDAETDKKRILAAAETQAAILKRDAELRIAAEIESARARLTREVTAAAAIATEKILREKATADDQKKLVGAFIADVQSAAVQTKDAR